MKWEEKCTCILWELRIGVWRRFKLFCANFRRPYALGSLQAGVYSHNSPKKKEILIPHYTQRTEAQEEMCEGC